MSLSGRRIAVIDPSDRGVALVERLVRLGARPAGPFVDIWAALEFMRAHIVEAAVIAYRSHALDTAVLAHALAEGGKPVLFFGEETPPATVLSSSPRIFACPPEASVDEAIAELSRIVTHHSGTTKPPPRAAKSAGLLSIFSPRPTRAA